VEGVQIKSRQYGWTLRYYSNSNLSNSLPYNLGLLCRWAIASLGWDFGAVDVLKVNDRFVLVELNSCPGLLDSETANAYAGAIKEHLDA
jgi:glutathione synthase/RimK-type ligase-like ATP-grasp enzyme